MRRGFGTLIDSRAAGIERWPLKKPLPLGEVNENTIASGIRPIHFGPAPADDSQDSTVVVEVTPESHSENSPRGASSPLKNAVA